MQGSEFRVQGCTPAFAASYADAVTTTVADESRARDPAMSDTVITWCRVEG